MGYLNAPIVIKIKLRFAATVFHNPAACAWSILGHWALRWVYTFDAAKRRLRRHALRWFAASWRVPIGVSMRKRRSKKYKPTRVLNDFQDTV